MIGDAIIDEYVYVKPLGRSPKENIISNKILHTEKFRGGVFAAAKHIETFCRSVDIRTGTNCTYKRRFVENVYLRKLFEVHEEGERYSDQPVQYQDYDLVIVTDFGHGAITQEKIEAMTGKARFLAVNAQTNSANHGFNLITKYPRADYVVLDDLEARLAAHDRESGIETILPKLGYKSIVVTLGPNGAVGYDGEIHRHSGTKCRVLDTMGAGDAFFVISSLFAKVGADMQTMLMVGNVAGAIKCSTVGHRESVTKDKLVDNVNQFV